MSTEIRKVCDTGNGSGRVVVPKEHLRELGLVDDDGELVEGHLLFDDSGDGTLEVSRVETSLV